MSDPNMKLMKHKKKVGAVLLIALLGFVTYMFLPKIVERIIVAQAAKRGWTVSMMEVQVKFLEVHLRGVRFSNADGTKSGGLEWMRVRVDGRLDPIEVEARNGNLTMTGPLGESRSDQAPSKTTIAISSMSINWRMSDSSRVRADGASLKMAGGNASVEAKSLHLETSHGNVDVKEAVLTKNREGLSFEAERVGVFARDAEAYMFDVKAKKLVLKPMIEAEFEAAHAALPRGLETDQITVKMRADAGPPTKVHFDVSTTSLSGQHKSLSKERIATSQVSTVGDFEMKALDDWVVKGIVVSGKTKVDVEVRKQQKLWVFAVELPSTPCQSVLEAIPETMREELNGVTFDGNMEGMFTVNTLEEKGDNPFTYVRLEHKCKIAILSDRIADVMKGKPFKRHIYSGSGALKEVTSGPGRAGWVSFSVVSPYMAKAVVTTEDPGFWGHHGFDMEAIRNSLRDNVKDRKFTRGASTIPMQLSKNVFLSRDKTATRKLQEFFLTIIVDQKMTKDRILEMYLNIVEFGPDVYGIGAAAQHYFGTDPMRLSLGQSVFLSSILPRPRATYFNPDGSLSVGKKSQVGLILDLMLRRGSISDEECRLAKEETMELGNESRQAPVDTTGWEAQ